MKILLPFFLFGMTGLFITSCQKEVNLQLPVGPDPNPSPSANDSIYLAKYIELDTTLPPGQDTISVYKFSYDNIKRVKQIYHIKNYPGFSTYYITTDFFYNGSDTLPYKTVELDQENLTYVDTSFYTYSNGFVSFDSSVNYRVNNNELLIINTISFSWTGNDVYVRSKYEMFSPSGTGRDSGSITITRQNGNIISQQDPNHVINDNMQMKFDDKVNPFYRTDVHYPVYYEHLFNSFSAQRNNRMEEIVFVDPSSPSAHLQYVYTYRADGYPLTVRKIDLLDPTENRKGLFFYTK